MVEFKEYVEKMNSRLNLISSLFESKKIVLEFDKLKKDETTKQEMIYFSNDLSKNESGMFIFGSCYFIEDLSEQEFKNELGLNSYNAKILRAYKQLSKSQKKIKISDILNQIQDKKKDSIQLHELLKRILTMSYYLNWEIKKDKSDIEGDSFIKIPDKFLFRLKQRFNFDQICSVYENNDLFIFLNTRGKLNLVFKTQDEFSKQDIVKQVFPVLRKVFGIKSIDLKE